MPQILEPSLRGFALRDLVDIVVVAVFIYQILLLIRGTRGVQLATGLGILLTVYAMSRILGLTTLNWLLSYVGLVIPIALLILFQPELRRMLEQLGRGAPLMSGFGSPLEREEAIRLVGDVARTARVLAIRKIGALLVLERTTGLTDVVETGIKVDAMVTVPLLMTIFHPNTPLHDGATIIRGNRVVASACLLPLSENPTLSKTLGTRHRAAIGITEETDAVAVVVSEETGVISVARGGDLQRGLSEEELKTSLLGLFGPHPQRSPLWWPWGRINGRRDRQAPTAPAPPREPVASADRPGRPSVL